MLLPNGEASPTRWVQCIRVKESARSVTVAPLPAVTSVKDSTLTEVSTCMEPLQNLIDSPYDAPAYRRTSGGA